LKFQENRPGNGRRFDAIPSDAYIISYLVSTLTLLSQNRLTNYVNVSFRQYECFEGLIEKIIEKKRKLNNLF